MPAWTHTLTVDASHDHDRDVLGIGIVVQERMSAAGRGPIVEEIAEAHMGIASGFGEVFAILRALQIASERGFNHLKVRSDANAIRRRLRERHRAGLEPEDHDPDLPVLQLARTLAWVDFSYVPRRKNQVAHRLARIGRLQAPQSSTFRAPLEETVCRAPAGKLGAAQPAVAAAGAAARAIE